MTSKYICLSENMHVMMLCSVFIDLHWLYNRYDIEWEHLLYIAAYFASKQ